jgi:hypothetical protein
MMIETNDGLSGSGVADNINPTNATKKVLIALNEKIDIGRLLNACAHLGMGFGASRDGDQRTELLLLGYKDASGDVHPHISGLSVIVLKANSNQLKSLRQKAREAQIPCLDFVSSMTEGSYVDQLERTGRTQPEDLVYFGVLLFGTPEQLRPLTRKYSLFRI